MTYIFVLICMADTYTVGYYVQWAAGLDSIRLAIGLTSIVRVLIVHAKGKTMGMNAGFFSYIMFQTNYTAWTRSISPFYKEIDSDTPLTTYDELVEEDSKFSH